MAAAALTAADMAVALAGEEIADLAAQGTAADLAASAVAGLTRQWYWQVERQQIRQRKAQ